MLGESRTNVNLQYPTEGQRLVYKRSLSTEEEQCLEKPVTRYSIVRISRHIKYWRNVARSLALSDVEIIQLESQHQSDSLEEQTFNMLHQWTRISEITSFKLLLNSLNKCQENDAVNFVLDNLLTLSEHMHQ